jgi:hypothetical protein
MTASISAGPHVVDDHPVSRRRRSIACAVLALSAGGSAAAAAPVPPATVGPVVLDDGSYAARRGLLAEPSPAPRLVPVPAVRGWSGRYARVGRNRIALFGRYLWLYEGPDPLHLTTTGWGIGESRYVGQVIVAPDGGFLQVASSSGGDGLARFDADAAVRWWLPGPCLPGVAPVPQAPAALAGGVVYAAGGRAAVIDDGTGAVIAPLEGLPEYPTDAVAAPDGTVRVVGPYDAPALVAYAPDGRRLWSRPLEAASATALTVAPDGTTYVGTWRGTGRIHDRTGEVVAVGPDGAIRWRTPLGRRPSRPAIDAKGLVWALTIDGTLWGVGPDGAPRFRRRVVSPAATFRADPVRAIGRDVLVDAASTVVRVASRPARPTSPAPALRVAPARMRLRTPPATCVAPPGGRPRTCIHRLDTGGTFRVVAPVGGTLRLEIRSARGRLITRLGPYRVLAGENRVRFHGHDGTICDVFHPCLLPPGGYRVRARVPLGDGRARWLSAPFRVIPSRGAIPYD